MFVLTLAAGLVAAGAACGSATPNAATVEFKKTSMEIDRSDFERELEALNDNKQLQAQAGGGGLSGAGKKTVDPRLAAGWLTSVIYDKLITVEFEDRKLKLTPADTEAARAQLTTQFGDEAVASSFPKWFQDRLVARNARAVAVRTALSGVSVSDESLRKYFEEHKADFGNNCVSHILVKTKPEADAVLTRLRNGEDFAAVARQVSIDTGSGAKGGDLGCNPKGVFVPEFDEAASTQPVGQLSDPAVQTQYGFHIIVVNKREEAGFESAREQARAALNAETQNAFREFLASAVTSAKVTVDERYGTFEAPGTGQAPEVVPPVPPRPNTERSDNTPATEPLEGEPPGSADNPTQPVG
ncbi:MAG TPA: peptidylprolyl isomerase [Acidimicrobiia bacterium]|nr:peptidylprolyl isomerase [Acidimicrobiia bacterium]